MKRALVLAARGRVRRNRRRARRRHERVQGPPGLRAGRRPVGARAGGAARFSSSSPARSASSSPGSTPSSARAALEVGFRGALGAPVNPGITTSTSAVFLGRLVRGSDPAASFRPHIGCIPASGGRRARADRLPRVSAEPGRPPPLMAQIDVHDRVRAATSSAAAAASGSRAPRTRSPSTRPTRRRRSSPRASHVTQTVRSGRVARHRARRPEPERRPRRRAGRSPLREARVSFGAPAAAAVAARRSARGRHLPARRAPPHALRRPLHERRRAGARRRRTAVAPLSSRRSSSCSRSRPSASPSRGRTCTRWSRATRRRSCSCSTSPARCSRTT